MATIGEPSSRKLPIQRKKKKNERAKKIIPKFFVLLERNRTPRRDAAKELGITGGFLTRIYNGDKFPSEELLQKMEEYMESHPPALPSTYEAIEELRRYLFESGKTEEEVANEIKTTRTNIGRWLSGQTVPDQKSLEKICTILCTKFTSTE